MSTIINPPTRLERILWAVLYALLALAGVWILINPPTSIETPLGLALTRVWGGFLTPGIVLAVATAWGRFRWEYALLPLCISGVGIYMATLWYLVPETPGRGPQALLISALGVGLLNRWIGRRRILHRGKNRETPIRPED